MPSTNIKLMKEVIEHYLDSSTGDEYERDMMSTFDNAALAFWVSVITYKRLSERIKKLEDAVLAIPVD